MTETNGWLHKPGVPLNPEKDGWHWVVSFDAEKTIVFWHGENQGNEGYWDGYPLWIAQDWTYLGLVLLPDEATALQKRADQSALGYAREARRADLFKFLHKRDVAALQARVAELEKQNDMLRHATDKLRAMFTELNARHEPLQRAFITAVELLNDAALEGKKDA